MVAWQLEGCATAYGEQHNETRTSAQNLHALFVQMGNLAKAKELAARFAIAG